MKTLTVEVRVFQETIVEMDVQDDYRIVDIKSMIKEGRYRTVSHKVFPSRTYAVMKEEVN
jgi:hypothetical protein